MVESPEEENQLQVLLPSFLVFNQDVVKAGWEGEIYLSKGQVKKMAAIFGTNEAKVIGFDIDGNLVVKVAFKTLDDTEFQIRDFQETTGVFGIFVFEYREKPESLS